MAANDEAVVSAVTEQLHEWPKSQPRRAVRMTAALYPFERLGSPITVNVGDAFRVGRIFDATKAAYAVGAALKHRLHQRSLHMIQIKAMAHAVT